MQPERTTLAWQRTALAFLVLGLAALRVGWASLGGWSLLPSGIVVVGAIAILVASRRRYLRSVSSAPAGRAADGRLPLLATSLALVLGVLGAALVVPLLLASR
jgi:uncharacterized membrane protein YidH (DUF202 family)